MSFTAADVMKLRDRTKLPMMECKAALTAAGGDFEKAVEDLRKKFTAVQGKFADREAAEGRVAVYIDRGAKIGAIVEVRCETAPSAKSDQFIALASDIAKQVALKNPATVEDLLAEPFLGDAKKTINDRVLETIGIIRENMKPHKFKRLEGTLGEYSHHDGTVGVLISVEGENADPELLRDICMHIAARSPVAARKEEVPAEVIAKETDIAKDQVANDPKNNSKPANILEMIVEGKLKTFFAENVLLEQPFVKDDSKTVGQLLSNAGLTLKTFLRYKVGEVG
ncbi:MAG: translation elongation factor Ts [Gemmataceae bacterium]|nr:translation elongation factor Ts [Gemmataceae bacterium]